LNKKCYIVGAGDNSGTNFSKGKNEYVIAADGGLATLEKLGIQPDFILGDFFRLRARWKKHRGSQGRKR